MKKLQFEISAGLGEDHRACWHTTYSYDTRFIPSLVLDTKHTSLMAYSAELIEGQALLHGVNRDELRSVDAVRVVDTPHELGHCGT